ncbi:sulfite exporter TauE/SafE family protein [Saccharopolyspora sp. K220]|uniref:sulfite exporter TauE/SafE family protein n=1 Tax=Saccharopolyspora soli TaxID=2926618 RepID=UPI001F5A2A13|nr:sulfite exporter TauE/SafE family protein [Saccharopolyspora soli]MCI2420639.1 sulfite exporter TauE/SafE family protein [Saccharopolyspora soli]
MDLIAVLLTGLFAGGVSCAAVQGGLLAGLITRQRRNADSAGAGKGTAAHTGAARTRTQTPLTRLADDFAPVGGFLIGKLVSHVVLGALLGALGSVVQLSVGTRTWLQLLAGVVIIAFGLAQLGVPGFRNIVIEPPLSWMRIVRDSSRSQSALAPTLLGVVSVLIPCGVTLSVEALALASGSPLAGAAIMATFVIGTSPLFALLGYAARKAATAWRGKLAVLTGIVVLITGLYTLNGGLELAGSPLAASRLAQAATAEAPAAPGTVSVQNGHQTVVVTASSDGYTPTNVQIRADLPTTLTVRSDNAQGCVRSFIIPSRNVDRILPAQGDTTIELGALPRGPLAYSCGMGMYTGTVTAN